MRNEKVSIYRDPRKKHPWVVRWYGDYDPSSGKARRYSKSFRLKGKADEFQAAKRKELDDGGRRDEPEQVTLHRYLPDWLSSRKPELSDASVDLYEGTIQRLKSYFHADKLVQSVMPREAAQFIAEQLSFKKGREGQPLSDWKREQIKRHCKTIFACAVEWGYLKSNPFSGLKRKKPAKKRWHRVKVKEYKALLDVVPTPRWKVFYALAYTSGGRRSELFALRWSDIDFDRGRLIIANHEGTADLPPFRIKDYEQRQIPLPDHTIDLLTAYQAVAPEGVPYILLTNAGFERVVLKWKKCQREGLPWKNRYMVNNALRDYKSHCRRAGIKPVGTLNIQTLRKSCGQNWADHLAMHVVKELMGHSSIATTQEYYLQVDEDQEMKAATSIQKLIESADASSESEKSDAQVTPGVKSRQIGGCA